MRRRLTGLLSITSAAALLAVAAPAVADPPRGDDAPRTVDTRFSDEEIRLMAETSGRTEAQQRTYLDEQQDQNNAYAQLHAQGHDYDGAYFDADNDLVVQADAGSADAKAAEATGLVVADPQRGEDQLEQLTAQITEASAKAPDARIATIAPDVPSDRVVVTVDGDPAAARQLLASYGDAVDVREGAANIVQTTFQGGDKMQLGGGYCSAGFPAKSSAGTRYMVWVGHCVENASTVSTGGGTKIGTVAGGKFVSYDGKDDQDIGIVRIDSEDSMSADVNDYGGSRQLDAKQGAWRAPVGTDTCKSGATSGITCGKVTGYGATVTYTDDQGQTQARVTGLGRASICTAPGDSGGSYVSGGYAVGMTSGGPSGQSCAYNGGYVSGSSYFEPVDDALNAYGLTFGS